MREEVLRLVKKYKVPLSDLNKEVLVDEELLEEVAEFLGGNVTALFAFPGLIFRYRKGLGLDTDERKVRAVIEEYGVRGELWEPPSFSLETEAVYLEPDYRFARDTLLETLSLFPRRAVSVTRESVLLSVIAEPGWREYSPITVVAELFYDVEDAFRVDSASFFPRGKSSLGMVLFKLRRPYPRIREFLSFLKKVFNTKRKRVESGGKRPWEMYPDELLEYFETTREE